jgi:hypothetical protein
MTTGDPASQQVSWWSVHEFVAAVLERAGSWPLVGSPAWCALDDTDPRKIVALFDAAQHFALRIETCQQARAEASHDISTVADWSGIARQIRQRRNVYIPREVA